MISLVQFGIVCFVALGSWTYGYCSAIIATTLGQPTFLRYLGLDTAPNAPALFGAINGLFSVGGFFGCIVCCWLADGLGRKKAILVGAVLAIVGSGLQAGAVHIAMFIAARWLTGLAVGILVILVPLYQSEIAPPRIRGFLVATHGAILGFGYIHASFTGFGFYFVNANAAQWRLPLAIQAFIPLLLALGVMFVPESPRWLLMQGRSEDALKAFESCRTESVSQTDEEAIRMELHLLQLQVAEEMKDAVPLIDFFKRPALRNRCFVAFVMMCAAQGTGTLVINNYSALIYAKLGLNTTLQLLLNACWLCMGPPGNFYNGWICDKIGRVKMMLIGLGGCILALIGECASVSVFQSNGSPAAGKAAVFFIFFFLLFFATHIDATTYIYAAEVFPNPVRARGLSIGISGLFLSSLIYLATAPTAFEHVGWKFYLLFITVSFVNMIVIYLLCPETKGMALEDIAIKFGDNITLADQQDEVIRRRFAESQYASEVLESAIQEKNIVTDTEEVHVEKISG